MIFIWGEEKADIFKWTHRTCLQNALNQQLQSTEYQEFQTL